MGTYASAQNVIDRLPGRDLAADGRVTPTMIGTWIDELEAEAEAALLAHGIGVPVTTTRGTRIMRGRVTSGAAARVERAAGTGGDVPDAGADLWAEWVTFLRMLHGDDEGVRGRLKVMFTDSDSDASQLASLGTDPESDDEELEAVAQRGKQW